VFIITPQKHFVMPLTVCAGILQPAFHMAYFQAVKAR